jgi:Family of unknown function (DUF6069)
MTDASRLQSRQRLRRSERVVAVLVSMMATAVVFLIATTSFGQHLNQPGFGGGPPQELTIWFVAATAGVAGLAAIGVLAAIERVSRRPAQVWLVASTTLLILSLGAPLYGEGIGAANKLALVSMHLTAGAVLIPLLYRSARLRQGET